MSDEWKIVQGLKKETQNNSFETNNNVSIANDYLDRTQNQREYQAIIDFWSKGESIYYKPKNKEDLISSFKTYIEYRKSNNFNLQGRYNNFNFVIESEDPLQISFNNNVVINDLKASSHVEFNIEKNFITVRNNENINDFFLNRVIEVTDSHNVAECYSFKSTGDENLDKKIKAYLVSINPNFVLSEKDNKIRRQIVSTDEQITPYIDIDGAIDDNITVHEDKYRRKGRSDKTYQYYIEQAQEYEKKCQDIYSLFTSAYKPVERQEDMDTKQRENQQKIERLKKIKRAKELIELSKNQDKEIAELESQIQMKGLNIDE